MYTCKEMRDIVKNRLRYNPRKENVQDKDYFDLIKRGVKRLHRIVVNINNSFYKKVHAQYIIHSDPTDVVAFPADLYKVISWKSHPTAAIGDGVISSTHYGESISWTEIDNGSNRGLMQLERAKDVDSAQDIEGSLMYVREPDMPTTWASTPDIPDGYDDWLIQSNH